MADRCRVCGGTEMVHAVDNLGRSYLGCVSCTIVPMDSSRAASKSQLDAAYADLLRDLACGLSNSWVLQRAELRVMLSMDAAFVARLDQLEAVTHSDERRRK